MKTIIELLDSGELANRSAGKITDNEKETRYHYFRFECDRYEYDWKRCPRSEGWAQYDTDQDAWYYGIWVHVERRIVVTYAEGDEYVDVYKTPEALKEALDSMAKFHGPPPPAFIVFSQEPDGNWTRGEFFDLRPEVK